MNRAMPATTASSTAAPANRLTPAGKSTAPVRAIVSAEEIEKALANLLGAARPDVVEVMSNNVFGEITLTMSFQNGKLHIISCNRKRLEKFN